VRGIDFRILRPALFRVLIRLSSISKSLGLLSLKENGITPAAPYAAFSISLDKRLNP
jgi:hypothetical protein